MKNKTWFIIAALAVAVPAGTWLAIRLQTNTAHTAVAPGSRSSEEQSLVDSVMESPERFEASAITPASQDAAPVTAGSVIPRPQLLSQVDAPPVAVSKTRSEPVRAQDLYFWKDYESLRQPGIRDPGSQEHRQGVVSLMRAQQRRLGQVER